VKSFRGKLQVIFEPKMVEKCTMYDITEYLPKSSKDVDTLFEEIVKIARGLENEYLKSLLFSFLDDENFVTLFKKAPSAKVHHHNYIGGLIEHTHSVLSLCKAICELYPELDRDLLLAGAILHDIGKITTYEYTTHIDVTEKGGLMEHIVLGYRMVEEKIKTIEKFPEELELRLLHIILSHHSYGEWGSPVKPMFEEAVALSYIDMLDSQLKEFIQVKKKEDERRKKGIWSSFSRRFDRFFYLGRGYSKEQEQKISEMKDGNTER
jgi:3'-5' exoribonuclease